nr:AAC(3) family N-acetyltransferase [Paenibacillus thiaminolyticus]
MARSFAVWGTNRVYITANHSLAYGLGEQSPIARLYELEASYTF